MGYKFTKKEALLYKQSLLENDESKVTALKTQLLKEIEARVGSADFSKLKNDFENNQTQKRATPGFDEDVSQSIKKKIAAALSDDEFVNWLDQGGMVHDLALKLSNQEMQLLKAGAGELPPVTITAVGVICCFTTSTPSCLTGGSKKALK